MIAYCLKELSRTGWEGSGEGLRSRLEGRRGLRGSGLVERREGSTLKKVCLVETVVRYSEGEVVVEGLKVSMLLL